MQTAKELHPERPPERPQLSPLGRHPDGRLLGLPQTLEGLGSPQELRTLRLAALGVEETQSRLTEEFASVARDYCDVTWGKALDAAGVPGDSSLRRPESVYYDPEIQPLSDSDPPPPEQPASASEAPAASLDLPASVEGPTTTLQDAGQGEKAEASQGNAPGAAPSQPEPDHQDPKTKA